MKTRIFALAVLIAAAALPAYGQDGSGRPDNQMCEIFAQSAIYMASRRDEGVSLESAAVAGAGSGTERTREMRVQINRAVGTIVYMFTMTTPADSTAIIFFACRRGVFTDKAQGEWFKRNFDAILVATSECGQRAPEGRAHLQCMQDIFR